MRVEKLVEALGQNPKFWELVTEQILTVKTLSYDVVTVVNPGDPENEQRLPISSIEWDAELRQLLLIQD